MRQINEWVAATTAQRMYVHLGFFFRFGRSEYGVCSIESLKL